MSKLTSLSSKTLSCLLWLGGAAALSFPATPLAQAQQPVAKTNQATPPTHDVIDEESLRKRVLGAAKNRAMAESKTIPVRGKAPSTESSLTSASILIGDGEQYSIIPIGSVLHLPIPLRSRIVSTPQGELSLWPDFLRRHADWLAAKEVTLEMSRGNTKAAALVMRDLAGDTRLVVATYKGSPITILEPINDTGGAARK